jgi:putative ABC transport system permease protein
MRSILTRMRGFSGLFSDLRFAARALLQRPGFTAVAIITLALGIGANAAIFSVANAVLLRPLAYRNPDRLVLLLADNLKIGVEGAGLAMGDFLDLRAQSRTLAGIAVYKTQSFDLTGGPAPEVLRGVEASPSLFPVLGVAAARGRTFVPEEESPARGKVVVLGDGLWRRRFGANPAVVGSALKLDGESYEVVGIAPSGLRLFKTEPEVWVPLTVPAGRLDRMSHYLGAVGRLGRGATVAQANAELRRLTNALAQEYPDTNKEWNARAVRLSSFLANPVRPALLVLSGAVGLLLLIACSNLANLLLARGAARQKETAIRAALGAPRTRLVRLFLVESVLLALIGAGVGLLLTFWGVGTLAATGPADFPRLSEIGIDRSVLLFTLILSLISGLFFGLFPALQLSRLNLNDLTKEGHGGGGRSSSRLRSALVVVEVALALVLLVGAALMLQGSMRLGRVEPGFDPEGALVALISLAPSRYATVAPQVQFFERLLEEARTLPGVADAAAASAVPLLPQGQNLLPFKVERSELPEAAGEQFAVFSSVTPGWFHTLRIPLLEGRDFALQDDASAPPVVIINQALARRFWPHQSPVGKSLSAALQSLEPVTYKIVGVVGAARERDLAKEPEPAIFAPYRQVPPRTMAIVLRAPGDPLKLAGALQRRVLALDADQPISRITTLQQIMAEAGARTRFYSALLGLFAVLGLALAAVGIYGVIAYSLTLRTQEMAVRLALGARDEQIFGLVIGGGVRLTLIGIGLGLCGAFALTHLLSSLLFGISSNDPLTFALVPFLLLLVAVLASYVPARRAVQIDPMLPLRRG